MTPEPVDEARTRYVPISLCPVSITEAQEWVNRHHRHHDAPQGGLFAVAVESGGAIIGVAVIGRPVAPQRQDGYTAEITRVCVPEGYPNACSMLYGAAWRAARALGIGASGRTRAKTSRARRCGRPVIASSRRPRRAAGRRIIRTAPASIKRSHRSGISGSKRHDRP